MVGDIIYFLGSLSDLPFGYLLCDGSYVDKREYLDLFKTIGFFYGKKESDANKFALPNLLGKYISGCKDRREDLGKFYKGVMQAHSHNVTIPPSGEHTHKLNSMPNDNWVYLQRGNSWFDDGRVDGSYEPQFSKDYITSSDTDGVHTHDALCSDDGYKNGLLNSIAVYFLIEY